MILIELNKGLINNKLQTKFKEECEYNKHYFLFRLDKHREFQKALGAKQPAYDQTMKCGKQLKDKAPKPDEPVLKQMLQELKSQWTTVCSKAVERQRKLEEALLFSGQFKDAMSALIEWLKKQEANLKEDTPVHGDLDTVMGLVEKHKVNIFKIHIIYFIFDLSI